MTDRDKKESKLLACHEDDEKILFAGFNHQIFHYLSEFDAI